MRQRSDNLPLKRLTGPWLGLALLAVAVFWLGGSAGTAQQPAAPADATSKVDFVTEIQPIFERSCYACHGPDQQMGQLRLDAKKLAFQGGMSGQAIVPGDAAKSTVYLRVAGIGDQARMPFGSEKLPDAEISLIREWIEQGATWPEDAGPEVAEIEKHWAYVKPRQPEPPAVKNDSWVRNPIDNFVLARLEKEGLEPSPEASKETLIRRLSLDIRGLPPSLEEVDAFLADRSPEAYENLVDQLLESPQYGERWARWWLDLARYADTNGYEKDRERSMWPYRDWVIRAFNRNMPFDQFTVEQIAGDMLPNATRDQKIASGFHRNTLINDEGGVDKEEFRVAAVLDRVNTTATVWLGSTLECAQCHNHKYDPFTQRDYYSFYAFLNNAEPDIEADSFNLAAFSFGPELKVPTPEQAAQLKKWEGQIARLEEALDRGAKSNHGKKLWETAVAAAETEWSVLEPKAPRSAGGAKLDKQGDQSVLVSGMAPDKDIYILAAETDLAGITGFRLEALLDSSLSQQGPGRGPQGEFVLSGFEVEIRPGEEDDPNTGTPGPPKDKQWAKFAMALSDTAGNGASVEAAFDGDPKTGWNVAQGGQAQQAVFLPEAPIGFPQGTKFTIWLKQESSAKQNTIGRFRLSVTNSPYPGAELIKPSLATPLEKRTTEQKERLSDYFRATAPELDETRRRLAEARKALAAIKVPTTLVMKELEEPRKTHVLVRGNFLDPAEEVPRAVPASLPPLPPGATPDRLALAKWLVSKDNPLTARVTVNRFWQQYFGRGIVVTLEDFGTRAEPPTHPLLLDWLATEFMRLDWDMKTLHRLILNSATYRQSSRITPERLERDPYNKLLARGPRFRVSAETVRDIALAVGGLLSQKVGGPSVFPPQPEGILKDSFGFYDEKARWTADTGENRFRRGLYTYIKRTAPYPSLLMFDAPRREVCSVERPRTNTPLQALTTLNDPAFVEAAVGLAKRMMREAADDPTARATHGFRLCVTRKPNKDELEHLTALYEKSLQRFRADPEAARALIHSTLIEPPAEADAAETAAWIVVANVLLNLDETITKG